MKDSTNSSPDVADEAVSISPETLITEIREEAYKIASNGQDSAHATDIQKGSTYR